MKERSTELVEGFRHSVPYINTHRGKTFVIMLGVKPLSMKTSATLLMTSACFTALAFIWSSFTALARK